jgi:hypothetical protein
VARCSVTLVVRKAVAWIKRIELPHQTVSGDLGQNARGGDGVAAGIPGDQGGLGIRQPFNPKTIDEDVLGTRADLVEGLLHSPPGGLANVDPVDDLNIDPGDRPPNPGMAGKGRKELVSLRLGELLGVVEAVKFRADARLAPVMGQNHGGGHDGPREGAATGLIHAGDVMQAGPPEVALVGEALVG